MKNGGKVDTLPFLFLSCYRSFLLLNLAFQLHLQESRSDVQRHVIVHHDPLDQFHLFLKVTGIHGLLDLLGDGSDPYVCGVAGGRERDTGDCDP